MIPNKNVTPKYDKCDTDNNKPLYTALIEKGIYELPVNIITGLMELHKNGGSLNYGTGRFPVSISNPINKKWSEVFKKVPRDLYFLLTTITNK